MSTRPLIRESLLILSVCGMSPIKRNSINNGIVLIVFVLGIGIIVESAMDILFNWKGLDSIDAAVEVVGCSQIPLKIFTTILHAGKLKAIFYNIDNFFWHVSECGPEFKSQIVSTNRFIKTVINLVTVVGLITVLAFVSLPLLFNTRKLPLLMYHPADLSKYPNYEIAYLIQLPMFIFFPAVVLGFDFLFVSLTVHLVNELKMISKKLTIISFDDDKAQIGILEEIRLIGKHHSLVLSCIKDMKGIYSIVLLNQFLMVMFLLCFGLLAIITSGFPPKMDIVLKAICYVTVYLCLLFLYCGGGTFLTFESQNVAHAAYHSDWWVKTQPKIRQRIVLIIRRAQKNETLMGGGMIKLNLESFANVIKNGLSFFMVAQTLFRKAQRQY